MKVPFYIIADVSGSMKEMGKIHLQRNLCRYVAQLRLIDKEKYVAINFRFYQWAQNVSEIVLLSNGDIPAFNAEGSSSLSVLSDFLSQHLKNTGRSMVLILSDGTFSDSDIQSFQSQLSRFHELIIRTVAVGADADLLKLKKISTNNRVHISENIVSAIDSTVFGSDEPFDAPASTAQILQSEQAESKEPAEDWDA
jgi:hypothetical protein